MVKGVRVRVRDVTLSKVLGLGLALRGLGASLFHCSYNFTLIIKHFDN